MYHIAFSRINIRVSVVLDILSYEFNMMLHQLIFNILLKRTEKNATMCKHFFQRIFFLQKNIQVIELPFFFYYESFLKK